MKLNEREKRISTKELLDRADKRLKLLLTTPISNLDKKYLRLLPPQVAPLARALTLSSLMQMYESTEGVRSYISFTGEEPTGWIVYRVEAREVVEFDICSFIDGPNPVLMRDAKNILDDLVDLYEVITFQSLPNNSFKRAYDKIVKHYGGKSWEEAGMIWYQIGSLEEEVSAASFAGEVPEHCSQVITMVEPNTVEEMQNEEIEKL